ncbi:hypothetical protein MBAV_003956 [Candidatus Magnetobacterium bavaricum]|uniref:Uncharacterized protein n=1 Tax=Candidatus Magnetobacterium bavaricum TaxID=29290 RepID=A0A0F3GPX2_9BACT|nr:hypothetical protein MBAV_003956 [Candidatus Magnetobacterium bavaricum]
MLVSSISHTTTSPSVFCQTMSAFLSPSRSATALIVHSGLIPLTIKPPLLMSLPSINHTATSPVSVFCQSMSALPSPLKSPAFLNSHSLGRPRRA